MSAHTPTTRTRAAATRAAVACAALLLAGCHAPTHRDPARPRNVILMMADDLASNDLSCYGGRNIQTPHLDAFAAESLRLTDYYAGSAVCTPSRMALLSGSYPARLGWRRGVLGYGFARGTGMSTNVHTIAEAFRDAGYHTAMAGKWHLGDGAMRPEAQGFDSSLYIRMSNNQNRDMYRDGALVQKDWDNRTLTEAFAEEALRVIEADRDAPFFLYLPWSAPHFPAEPHPDWAGRSGSTRAAQYKDVVESWTIASARCSPPSSAQERQRTPSSSSRRTTAGSLDSRARGPTRSIAAPSGNRSRAARGCRASFAAPARSRPVSATSWSRRWTSFPRSRRRAAWRSRRPRARSGSTGWTSGGA